MSLSKYKKLTQREHVLLRKNMYCGDSTTQEVDMYVVDDINDVSNINIKKKKIKYNAAFIKLFDEIISNASDASIRDNNVSYIKTWLDTTSNTITVENDCIGGGIPVEIHPTENIYIPEMLFSSFLTGSNYDDVDKREFSGMNGIGQKMVSVLSTSLNIDIADGKKSYKQEFKDNLSIILPPTIKTSNKFYVKVSYQPDFKQFEGIENIDNDSISIILKRIVDLSVYSPNIKFYFNDKIVKVKSFKEWMKLHLPENTEMYIDDSNDKWIYGVAKSPTEQYETVSVASSVSTYRGGTHTNYISLNLSKAVADSFSKKIKANWVDVKNKMILFLIAKIPNPTFDSQSKECLTNQINKENLNGFKINDTFVKKIMKSEIVESILRALELKEKDELRKLQKSQQKMKVEKLVDANSKDRKNCQLFIFEGECLEENTEIRLLEKNIPIKYVEVGDTVITHNNRFSTITSVNKKIEKKVIIKNRLGDISCSEKHRWFVYDNQINQFYFIETKDLDKTKHKLVKNYLAFMESLLSISLLEEIEDEKYDFKINFKDDFVFSTKNHKFACYNKETEYFEMVECQDLKSDIHLIVNKKKD